MTTLHRMMLPVPSSMLYPAETQAPPPAYLPNNVAHQKIIDSVYFSGREELVGRSDRGNGRKSHQSRGSQTPANVRPIALNTNGEPVIPGALTQTPPHLRGLHRIATDHTAHPARRATAAAVVALFMLGIGAAGVGG